MHSAESFRASDGPYCQCCGSRDVMTLDLSTQQTRDYDRQSNLRVTRLWLAIDDLTEFELSDFICDASIYVGVEYFDQVEAGFFSYLSDNAALYIDERHAYAPDSFLRLETIDVPSTKSMLARRKMAFMRIWNSFDETIKQSFIRRVLGQPVAIIPPGGAR